MRLTYAGKTTKNDFRRSTWLTECGNYRITHSVFTLSDELSPKFYAERRVASDFGTGTRWEIIGRHNRRKAALRKLFATQRADARLASKIERDADQRRKRRRRFRISRRMI